MSDPQTNRAIALATQALAQSIQADPAAISCVGTSKRQLPNPPLSPGEVSTNPVIWEFTVVLGYRQVRYTYRVAHGMAKFAGQEG